MHIPPDYALFIPSAIRAAVQLPVVGVGRFKDPLQAERALAQGHCDLVGVVRGQIADAEFAAKARAGHHNDIRLCLSCNQECVGRMGLNRWLGCIENPRTGREHELGATAPTAQRARRRRVLVIGAGPAGMQTAISAAEAGHDVEVWEREDVAGGQARWAAQVPSRAEFGDLVRNLTGECRRLGVRFCFGRHADTDAVLAGCFDAVVVATGAVPSRPWWAPPDDARICDVLDVVQAKVAPHGDVVVIDELGFHQATSVAELLADRGCAVEVLSPAMVVGQDLGITLDLETWWMRAMAKGIRQTVDSVVVGADEHGLVVLHHPTGATTLRPFDFVVLAVPPVAADTLYHELHGRVAELHRVGDCVAPRRAHAAVIDGRRVGASL